MEVLGSEVDALRNLLSGNEMAGGAPKRVRGEGNTAELPDAKRQKIHGELVDALNDESAIAAAEALLSLNVDTPNLPMPEPPTDDEYERLEQYSGTAATALDQEISTIIEQNSEITEEDVSVELPMLIRRNTNIRIRATTDAELPTHEIVLSNPHFPDNLHETLTETAELDTVADNQGAANQHQANAQIQRHVDNRVPSLRRKALLLNMLKHFIRLLVDAIALLRLESTQLARFSIKIGNAAGRTVGNTLEYLRKIIIKTVKCISMIMYYFITTFPLTSTVLLTTLSLYYSQTLRTYIASQGYEISMFVLHKLDRLLYQFIGATAAEVGPAIAQTVGGWVKTYITTPLLEPIKDAFMAYFTTQAAAQAATNTAQTQAIQDLTRQVALLTQQQGAQTTRIMAAIQAQEQGGVVRAITNGVGHTAGGFLGNVLIAAGMAGRAAAGPALPAAMGGKKYNKAKKSKKSKTKKTKKTRKTQSRKKRNSRNKKRITFKTRRGKKSIRKIKLRRH